MLNEEGQTAFKEVVSLMKETGKDEKELERAYYKIHRRRMKFPRKGSLLQAAWSGA